MVAGGPAQPVRQDPGDPPGLPAIAACLAEGISVNVTLIFSLARYEAVMDAFLDGMETRTAPAAIWPGSVRWPRSSSAGSTPRSTPGWTRSAPRGRRAARKAAIANARLAYQHYERMIASERWQALAAAARDRSGRCGRRPVKDPSYPDTRYVVELVAPGVVNTMPEATLRAVADHGVVPADSIRDHYAGRSRCWTDWPRWASTTSDVVQTLEDQAVTAFTANWDRLSQQVSAALHDAAHRHRKDRAHAQG